MTSERMMMRDPVFSKGDKVMPIYLSGYHLTMGKVTRWSATACPSQNYTWPAVVQIHDDRGKLSTAHARRFKLV